MSLYQDKRGGGEVERDGKGRKDENVPGREMYALKLREKTWQELKEVQYGGLLGEVRVEFQEKPD